MSYAYRRRARRDLLEAIREMTRADRRERREAAVDAATNARKERPDDTAQ